jgi:diguanylate cyclase (GGDEF)-like protein/PAS domain S-box-containing protein
MNSNNPIRLLILNDSREEANRLISMLSNAGKTTDAQHIESEEALIKVLQERSWDLLIGHVDTLNLTPELAQKQIRKLDKDVPMVLLTDQEGSQPVVEWLKKGAADVLLVDDDQRLLQVINRELNNKEYRSQSRYAQRKLKDVERRNQQLLDSSKDAIAFVEDGMFLYTNDSFAELLGYPDRSDIECMPIIDVIDPKDQDMLKDFLKNIATKGNMLDTQVLAFNVLSQSGDSKTLHVDISLANYDDETCIQLLVPGVGKSQVDSSGNLAANKTVESFNGLVDRSVFFEKLYRCLDLAAENEQSGAVIHIDIDQFLPTVVNKVGALAADRALKIISNYLKSLCPEGAIASLFGGSAFLVLLANTQANAALQLGETLCSRLREFYVDIDGSSLQFQYYVGVGLFSETTTTPDTPIMHALKACELARKDDSKLAELYEPPQETGEAATRSDKEVGRLIQKALEGGRFKLLFQPILSLRGSTQEHYEVLMRMIDSKGNEITPEEFLDVATAIGLTVKIDRWVILESLKTLTSHRANGHNTRLIINLSAASIKDNSLPGWLAIAFNAAKLPTDSLVFQIAEQEVNDHITQAKILSEKLTDLGASVCISRFGCNVSPFNALQHVPAKYIKLDGSYTHELQEGSATKFSNLVNELHTIEKITIVPFVENASVLSKLWQSGVHYIQGYYLQAPTASMDFEFDSDN